MRQTVVVGLQYGDEGKGKIADALVERTRADLVVRFNGGGNAGHSVVVDGYRRSVHQLPVGVFHPGVRSLMGTGMVIDPIKLRSEIEDRLGDSGSHVDPLFISDRAHLVTEEQVMRDAQQEEDRDQPIGTTRTGNGPAYSDKAARSGFTVRQVISGERIPEDASVNWMDAVGYLAEYAVAGESAIDLAHGDRIVFEGAHGTMLDIDWGTYPFVTSSACTTWSAAQGSGIPLDPRVVVVGVAKAYLTRVAAGAFCTEIQDVDLANRIREDGNEYGTTTGRPRRIGWLDLEELTWAAQFNRCNVLALTLTDVLGDLDWVRVRQPSGYELIQGWSREEVQQAADWDDLPDGLRKYIEVIEDAVGVPVGLVSTGPNREDLHGRGAWL